VINQDLERFRQQFNDKFDYIKSHNKVKSIFINEDYLRGDPNDMFVACIFAVTNLTDFLQ